MVDQGEGWWTVILLNPPYLFLGDILILDEPIYVMSSVEVPSFSTCPLSPWSLEAATHSPG